MFEGNIRRTEPPYICKNG
jgi:hypothetical protein